MAGAADKPGDSMPTAFKKPGAPSASPMMKSCSSRSTWARRPAKLVIVRLPGSVGTLFRAFCMTLSSPAAVVFVASGSCTSTAVGPMRRLP